MGMKDRLGQMKQRAQDAGKLVVDVGVETAREKRDAATGLVKSKVDAATGYAIDKRDATVNFAGDAKSALKERDVEELLRRLPLPSSPVDEHWQWSLAKLITAGNKPPTGTGMLLGLLDNFGTIDIGPEEVGFDGAQAKWHKVQAIRTRSLDGIVQKLSTDGFTESIETVLPPVPGRGWVAEKATSAIFTLWAMVADLAVRDPEAGRRQIVCEIEYKGWIRTKEAETGFFTGPVMALLPGLDQVFRAEAQRHGVLVEEAEQAPIANAEARVAWLREKHAALLAKREALGGSEVDGADGREPSRRAVEAEPL
ncbi:hypothetical protein K3N28_12630 [Glycomyces sp. TRM65418]|uniref:hypothetical protein n=1 Tax=Glycomyces sp. TRM65418 TaxID=2867006 RepID=UPI001CE69423|nr:hypothetical protein [Glycomyces sp. TRM65418]MCC3763910.1 hypothetical protein [Glycomyces sp. TRM65418]QZD53612.1 hypothetical protein K3N28_12560 [Glycomyces sp. TRM65418]